MTKGWVLQKSTLTAAVDNFTGTSGDDTFIGGTAQIQAADVINGAAGNDVAKLYLDTGNAGLNSSNVEQFFIQSSVGGGGTFTATNVDGAKEFWSNESTTALTITASEADKAKKGFVLHLSTGVLEVVGVTKS